MKYVKATALLINLNEEDIIATSGGCLTANFQQEDSCTGGNHQGKYSGCKNNGHQKG